MSQNKYKNVITTFLNEGYSEREIGNMFGLSQSTISKLYSNKKRFSKPIMKVIEDYLISIGDDISNYVNVEKTICTEIVADLNKKAKEDLKYYIKEFKKLNAPCPIKANFDSKQ